MPKLITPLYGHIFTPVWRKTDKARSWSYIRKNVKPGKVRVIPVPQDKPA